MNTVISPLPGTRKQTCPEEHEQEIKPIVLFSALSAKLSCEYLQEPQLVFSDRRPVLEHLMFGI